MAGVEDLDPFLQWAVLSGLMTEGQARDVDAFADGLVQRRKSGELTLEQAGDLAAKQGAADATAILAARGRE